MAKRTRGSFRPTRGRTREAGRKGGFVKARNGRAGREPYAGTILDIMDAAKLTGPSWARWRAFWKAVFALPMEAADVEIFRRHTARERPPGVPVSEAWM